MMTTDDCEGWLFVSHPHKNNGFFFLPNFMFERRLQEVPKYVEMLHDIMTSF